LINDEGFLRKVQKVKMDNKAKLAEYIQQHYNIDVDPSSMYDMQVKRIHEYKRQLLNAMHIIVLYNRIKANPNADVVARTVMVGGKVRQSTLNHCTHRNKPLL
jgi:starch phosphorylase